MCTIAKSLTFTGQISINGQTTQYNNQQIPIPLGFTNCLSKDGNKLNIRTTTPLGTYNNTLNDYNGKINGILRFPGAIINLNGIGNFN